MTCSLIIKRLYRDARQAFGVNDYDHHVVGQCDPIKLSKLIAVRHPNYPGAKLRRLVQAWVYRGVPSSSKDPVGYRAARRQVSRWQKRVQWNWAPTGNLHTAS